MKSTPLCVDLDNSLIKTDLSLEASIRYALSRPYGIFCLLWWFLKGRAYLKARLANSLDLDYETIPIHQPTLDYLKEQSSAGRSLILVTGSPQKFADGIGKVINIFNEVIGTSSVAVNLIGENKRKYLVKRFGEKGFDYLGDSKADLKVWKSTDEAIVVSSRKSFIEKVQKITNVSSVIPRDEHIKINQFKHILKQVKITHWLKNSLIFIPLITAHEYFNTYKVLSAFFAFLGFCCTASLVYIFNDLVDLPEDRKSTDKKTRPLASGNLKITNAVLASCGLLFLGGLAFANTTLEAFAWSFSYMILNLIYSLYLKKKVIIDIFTLTSMFLIRLQVGASATDVPLSNWLFAFGFFFFLSLSVLKRVLEIERAYYIDGRDGAKNYLFKDLSFLKNFGIGTYLNSTLIFILYIHSPEAVVLYSNPQYLWPIPGLIALAVSRLWLDGLRRYQDSDPVKMAMKDWMNIACIALSLVLVFLGKK